MKKSCVLLIAICAVSFVASAEQSKNVYYGVFVSVIRGFSEKKESKCATALVKNEKDVLDIIDSVFKLMDKGKPFENIITSIGLKLFMISDLAKECDVFSLTDIYNKLSTDEGIVDIMQTSISNLVPIMTHGMNILDHFHKRDVNGIGEELGGILSIILKLKKNP